MTYRIIVKAKAEIDLLGATKWYESKKTGLGVRFLKVVDRKVERIKNNPNQYQLRYRNIRMAPTKPFPYLIHFIVEENTVFIIAVMSGKRNPKLW